MNVSALEFPIESPRRAALFISILRGVAETRAGSIALTDRDLELVFLLNADGRCVSAARLADALWPDADPVDAQNRLHVAIHRLRRRVRDAACIRRERFGYRLGTHVTCDLHEIAASLRATTGLRTLDDAERQRLADAYERLCGSPAFGDVNGSPVFAAIETRIADLRHALASAGYGAVNTAAQSRPLALASYIAASASRSISDAIRRGPTSPN